MTTLTVDIETTTFQKGNAFAKRNYIVNIGYKLDDGPVIISYMDDDKGLEAFKQAWKSASVIVAFNAKFELHWLRRVLGITVEDHQRIYDPQLAFFVLTNQQHRYPSLDQVLEFLGLETKLDVVKTEYWDKGIDTPDIPKHILDEYLEQDVRQTYKAAIVLQGMIPNTKRRLVQLQMADLVVLAEMEFNGLLYNKELSLRLAEETRKELDDIDRQLTDIVGVPGINFNSNDQLSAVLYGGTIVQEHKEDFLFQYKDPRKTPVIKQRKVQREYPMPRLVEPLPKSEAAKEGVWYTNEPVLKSLNAKGKGKEVIQLLLKRATLEKLVTGYYKGIPDLMEEKDWPDNWLHPNLNQCTATTGRLSSSSPNAQNISKDIKKLFNSRFSHEECS